MRGVIGIVLALALLAGCTAKRELPGLPEALANDAVIPGYDGSIWQWGDLPPEALAQSAAVWREQIARRTAEEGRAPNGGVLDVLVLSGGGSDGAYGAGLLDAWDEKGGRPEFTLVTGISIGALIAPFAFLGPEYDATLREVLDRISQRRQVKFKPFFGLFSGLAASDTTTMQETLEELFTAELVAEIGREHMRGRRLWIGTTNLDAQRPVTWNVGAIAASGHPGAPALIRDILRASAAIPGLLPPVSFEVEAAGRRYSQIHVDGGVTRQFFLYASATRHGSLRDETSAAMRAGTIYVIRNANLSPDYQLVELGLLELAQRAVSTLIRSNAADNAVLLAEMARREGFASQFTAVPPNLGLVERELFDPDYMRALYSVGYNSMLNDDPWIAGRDILVGVGIVDDNGAPQ
ncbi:patatin-like phospholipase family protein [Limibaculum sp. M0105]|uniref:Patatin-like phospholipase family protein n=1 Tax=Thermohalobaculum xanthum TaxID=2753746 RepID=A0A8J7M7V7_9RHOB|nr:patatin-like phospholipase family protein [Thermohalobaculum xanthum]MBK0400196.1 patatin-like phospholipase family protein [Thermohalobaculum xanthum]